MSAFYQKIKMFFNIKGKELNSTDVYDVMLGEKQRYNNTIIVTKEQLEKLSKSFIKIVKDLSQHNGVILDINVLNSVLLNLINNPPKGSMLV